MLFAGPSAATKTPRHTTWSSAHLFAPKPGVAKDYVFVVTRPHHTKVDYLLADPMNISKVPLTFANVISDKAKVTAAGMLLLILKFHKSNLVYTSPLDTAFRIQPHHVEGIPKRKMIENLRNWAPEIRRDAIRYCRAAIEDPGEKPILSLKKVLELSTGGSELLLVGTSPQGKRVTPIGIMVRTSVGMDGKQRDLESEAEVKRYEATARRWNVPVSRAEDPYPWFLNAAGGPFKWRSDRSDSQ